MDELREQLASVGAQATGPAGACSRASCFTDPRGLAILYIPAAPIRERYLGIAPDGASGHAQIAWLVLRMAG